MHDKKPHIGPFIYVQSHDQLRWLDEVAEIREEIWSAIGIKKKPSEDADFQRFMAKVLAV